MTYFTYGGAYYQRVSSVYRVVSPPPEMVIQAPFHAFAQPPISDNWIAVIAERLNVRAGPGLNQAVVGQVIRGTQLVIQGSSAGWWYVQLPGGESGWVMAAFTTLRQQPVNG